MGKFVLLFVVIVASATFFFTSQSFKQHEQQSTQQNQHRSTWIDTSGKLHTMGLVLHESTVRDAELTLRSRSQSAIFMYPEKSESDEQRFRLELEAYFPSIADHSKIMLVVNIDEVLLEAMRQRGSNPRIYPNGVIRVNLSNKDIFTVKQLTFKELRLVPSLQLDVSMLEARFGKAESVKRDEKGDTHYLYPQIGLDALIKEDAKDILSFSLANKHPEFTH